MFIIQDYRDRVLNLGCIAASTGSAPCKGEVKLYDPSRLGRWLPIPCCVGHLSQVRREEYSYVASTIERLNK